MGYQFYNLFEQTSFRPIQGSSNGARVFIRSTPDMFDASSGDCFDITKHTHVFILEEPEIHRSRAGKQNYTFASGCVYLVYALEMVYERPKQILIVDPTIDGWRDDVERVIGHRLKDKTRSNVVVMDTTDTYDCPVNAHDFASADLVEETKIWDSEAAVYMGDTSVLGSTSVDALYNTLAIKGGHNLRRALPKVNGESSEEGVRKVFNAMFLDKVSMMGLYPEGEEERWNNGKKRLRELQDLALVPNFTLVSAPLPRGEFAEHLRNLFTTAKMADDVVAMWNHVGKGLPFFPIENGEDSYGAWSYDGTGDIDVDKLMTVGRSLGLEALIDAYLDGTPLEDLLA